MAQELGITAEINLDVDDTPVCKALGIYWDVQKDPLVYVSWKPPVDIKRGILSVLSTVFDPLGLLHLFTLRAKLLLQQLWAEGSP